jgi:organic hydroperoxide reductase OsmC/OhrA
MIKYPLYFQAVTSSASGIDRNWSSSASDLQSIECAIPQEFGGPGQGYSPEDLMIMAVINCFVATFKVFAQKSSLEFLQIQAKGILEINRTSIGTVGITSLKLDVNLQGASDTLKAKTILEETRKNCLMGNALKITVDYSLSTS